MDMRQLEMLRAVAEEGTFSRAAERLHVTQSAVSRQVKLLEDELKTVLLHRGPRGATVTPAGQLLVQAAHRVQRELADVVGQIGATGELQRGALSLGGGMTVCMYVLPRLLRRFRARWKQIDLKVTTGTSDLLLRGLRARELDLCLLTLPLETRDMEILPVLREEMVVATAPGHPLARSRVVDPSRLSRFPLVLFERGSSTRTVLDQYFRDHGLREDVVMETENVEVIKAMVGSGLGATIVPWAAIARDVKHGRFAWARLRGPRLYRETAWVYLRSGYVPRVVTEVLALFEEIKGQFPVGPGRTGQD